MFIMLFQAGRTEAEPPEQGRHLFSCARPAAAVGRRPAESTAAGNQCGNAAGKQNSLRAAYVPVNARLSARNGKTHKNSGTFPGVSGKSSAVRRLNRRDRPS